MCLFIFLYAAGCFCIPSPPVPSWCKAFSLESFKWVSCLGYIYSTAGGNSHWLDVFQYVNLTLFHCLDINLFFIPPSVHFYHSSCLLSVSESDIILPVSEVQDDSLDSSGITITARLVLGFLNRNMLPNIQKVSESHFILICGGDKVLIFFFFFFFLCVFGKQIYKPKTDSTHSYVCSIKGQKWNIMFTILCFHYFTSAETQTEPLYCTKLSRTVPMLGLAFPDFATSWYKHIYN